MTESTPIVAFDQHAASVMAAVLLPGDRTPALHPVPPDLPSIRRFLERLAVPGVRCCYEAGPCGFDLQRSLAEAWDRLRGDRARADPAARRQSGQNGPARRRSARSAVSGGSADGDSHSHRARRSGARSTALPRRHLHRSAARETSALEILIATWAALPGRAGVVETLLCVARPCNGGRSPHSSRRSRRIDGRLTTSWRGCARSTWISRLR